MKDFKKKGQLSNKDYDKYKNNMLLRSTKLKISANYTERNKKLVNFKFILNAAKYFDEM